MKVERRKKEILIRFSANTKASTLQDMLDYLRFEELTSRPSASQRDINKLILKAKKGRWGRVKSELSIDGKD
ncbi:MAG TPA: hypothetical protein VI583_02590, partial [Cyclobacteriaceae bacterium]|nr:hypothetical protein [Cyclobacteriaceae bacterium]